jgi:chaperonin cofactor prefoldin
VRVFNAQFDFVELSMRGAAIDRKSVHLPARLLGLTEMQNALQTRLHLVEDQNTRTGQRLQKMKAWIIKTFLKHIPGYGFIVLRTNKERLMMAVDQLERCARKAQRRIWREVQAELDRKRKALVETLLPLYERSTGMRPWLLPDGMKKYLDAELGKIIGRSADLVKDVEVRLVFKAVTYESLVDPKFIHLVRANVPELQHLHEEFDAATAKPLFENPPQSKETVTT